MHASRYRSILLGLAAGGLVGATEFDGATTASGGGFSEGGDYRARTTTGQPMAGRSAGGDYVMTTGFVPVQTPEPGDPIFSDGFEG